MPKGVGVGVFEIKPESLLTPGDFNIWSYVACHLVAYSIG